ncbi:MAG TPA: tetratricopeptide repeat protein, partial [Thermoanaerobaculia bacterium]|nr:tetratricopeptide repeat protein [Thermoanaerobaculia bacterium]
MAAAERALAEGRVEEAVARYRGLAAERPGDARVLANLGRVLALAVRYGEAAEVRVRAGGRGAE